MSTETEVPGPGTIVQPRQITDRDALAVNLVESAGFAHDASAVIVKRLSDAERDRIVAAYVDGRPTEEIHADVRAVVDAHVATLTPAAAAELAAMTPVAE